MVTPLSGGCAARPYNASLAGIGWLQGSKTPSSLSLICGLLFGVWLLVVGALAERTVGDVATLLMLQKLQSWACVLGSVVVVSVLLRHWMPAMRQPGAVSVTEDSRYWEALDYARCIIIRLDPQGRILSLNAFGASLLGFPTGGAVGMNLLGSIIPERDNVSGDLAEQATRLWTSPDDLAPFECEVVTRSGERLWIAWTARAVRNEQGQPVEALCIGADISTRKSTEDNLRRFCLTLEAQVSESMAAMDVAQRELGALSDSVADNLRPPLRNVLGFSRAILQDSGEYLDPEGRAYLERIVRAVERMDTLSEELTTYGRLMRDEMRLRPVSLELVLTEARDALAWRLQDTGATLDIACLDVSVQGHHQLLALALAHLLDNAIKYTPQDKPAQVRVWAELHQASARIWVEDNGIGIPQGDQERVFEAFQRLHGIEAYPGAGLGLTIVQKAAQRMGGSVGVASTPGQGSKFWLDLPLASVA